MFKNLQLAYVWNQAISIKLRNLALFFTHFSLFGRQSAVAGLKKSNFRESQSQELERRKNVKKQKNDIFKTRVFFFTTFEW
jgi:hypothetical protein